MTNDTNPPPPLPSAQSPYPAHSAHQDNETESRSAEYIAPAAGAGLGPLGMTLIGGAVAAVGLAIALPFLRRRKKSSAKPARKRAKASKSDS